MKAISCSGQGTDVYYARHNTRTYIIENRRWDPITGTISTALGVGYDVTKGATNIVIKPLKVYHERSRLKAAEAEDVHSNTTSLAEARSSRSAHLMPPQAERSRSASRGCHNTVSALALASATGAGTIAKSYGKFFIDAPYAFTEGLRAFPKLYGEEVKDRQPITDWESGAMFGGKHFVTGTFEGLADLVYQPYKGAQEGGAAGAVIGVGKGFLNMMSKTVSGMSIS